MERKEKLQALANYLGVEPDYFEEESYDDNAFESKEYNEEYLVLTEDEARDYAEQDIREIYDDLGLESFTPEFQEWIMINALDSEPFEELLDEEGEFSKSKYRNLIGKVSLKEAYELFEDHKKDIDKKASSLAKQKDARRKASSGNFGNSETTEISYENMTKEQRKAYRDSIRSR